MRLPHTMGAAWQRRVKYLPGLRWGTPLMRAWGAECEGGGGEGLQEPEAAKSRLEGYSQLPKYLPPNLPVEVRGCAACVATAVGLVCQAHMLCVTGLPIPSKPELTTCEWVRPLHACLAGLS